MVKEAVKESLARMLKIMAEKERMHNMWQEIKLLVGKRVVMASQQLQKVHVGAMGLQDMILSSV